LQRDFVIQLEGIEAADLHHDDDVVGGSDGLAPVERGRNGGRQAVLGDEALHEAVHGVELGPCAAHQHQLAVLQGRRGENVLAERLAEHETAGADHRYLGHGGSSGPRLPRPSADSFPIAGGRCGPRRGEVAPLGGLP